MLLRDAVDVAAAEQDLPRNDAHDFPVREAAAQDLGSLVIVALAVWLFFRMSDSGQFDDMEGPAHSILMDDDRPKDRAAAPEAEAGPPE